MKGKEKGARSFGGRAGGRGASTAFTPSVTYGVSIKGMADGMLASLRARVGRARGSCRGRSTSARLLMEGTDPAWRVVTASLMQWAEAWWDKLVDHGTMTKAWRHAVVNVGMAARPNVKVRGGAGAMMAALRMIKWTAPSPEATGTMNGTVLYFGEGRGTNGVVRADPRSLRKWVWMHMCARQ